MNRLLCIIALSLCGCAHISGERKPDGTMTVRTTRFMWSTQNLEFSVNDGTNVVATLRAKKSSPDAEALGAIAGGVARGLKSGVAPGVTGKIPGELLQNYTLLPVLPEWSPEP